MKNQNNRAIGSSYHRAIEAETPISLSNIRVILFEPQGALNIGSVARAMKGMGLSELCLVRPVKFENGTWQMAHGAIELLENCRIVENFEEALDGIRFLVGTTHRRRTSKLLPPVPVRSAAEEIVAVSASQKVAILFGREDFGLSTDLLSCCQLTASVPMATKNPSLNLAQAVQIFAYELFIASTGEISPIEHRYATLGEVEAFYNRMIGLVKQVGVKPYNGDWRNIHRAMRRVFSRVRLESRDIATLDLIFSNTRKYIDRLHRGK